MAQLPSVVQIVDNVLTKTLSPSALCAELQDLAQKQNPELLAMRHIDTEGAQKMIAQLQQRLSHGERALPLAGVPVIVKDNMAQAGVPNCAGRKSGGEPAAQSSAVVQKLTQAGAIIVGRANMDELAYGVTGTNPHTGQVKNPVNPACHPGGSSAGSGSAVAAGFAPLALGTDTAGSVRIPASLCGLVGLRPTQGRIPTQGVAPLCHSLDTVGPLARTVEDLAQLASVLLDEPAIARIGREPERTLGKVHAIALDGAFAVPVDSGVQVAFLAALDTMTHLGVHIAHQSVPELADAPRTSGPIIGSEAAYAWSKELEQFPERFGDEVANNIKKGATLTAVRYLKAVEQQKKIVKKIDALFESADFVLLPTTATTATPVSNTGAQLQFLALTVPFSLSGHPALSVPMGLVDGLPVGLQIVARRNHEEQLLHLGHLFEQATLWRSRSFEACGPESVRP